MSSTSEEPGFNWDYDHPAAWSKHYPCADGLCQSPIDIITAESIPEFYPSFNFSADYQKDHDFTLTNNGRQILVTSSEKELSQKLTFTGSGLLGTFNFVNFHLHWGPTNQQGSEHHIDGQRFPAEAHFVHQNEENGQIAVLAVLFTIPDDDDNEDDDDDEHQATRAPENPWEKYIASASQVTTRDQTSTCKLNLSELMSVDAEEFYRYVGSLTTPPCTEGILWTVFINEIPIRTTFLNRLREKIMRKTYRPIQPLNGRTIFRNYQYSKTI